VGSSGPLSGHEKVLPDSGPEDPTGGPGTTVPVPTEGGSEGLQDRFGRADGEAALGLHEQSGHDAVLDDGGVPL
jgi:hypothetical protein